MVMLIIPILLSVAYAGQTAAHKGVCAVQQEPSAACALPPTGELLLPSWFIALVCIGLTPRYVKLPGWLKGGLLGAGWILLAVVVSIWLHSLRVRDRDDDG